MIARKTSVVMRLYLLKLNFVPKRKLKIAGVIGTFLSQLSFFLFSLSAGGAVHYLTLTERDAVIIRSRSSRESWYSIHTSYESRLPHGILPVFSNSVDDESIERFERLKE
jgi:hypothetical protein